MSAQPPVQSRSAAFAGLRDRLAYADEATKAALEAAERAYEAIAFERASLESRLQASSQQTERQLQKALMIGRVAEAVNSSLQLDHVLRQVMDNAVEVMKAERGFLMIDDGSGTLHVAATHGMDKTELESAEWVPSRTTVNKVFTTGEAVVTTDAQQDPRFNVNLSVRALKLRSIMCVPLAVRERRIGVVYLDSRIAAGLFGRQDPELLTAFANQAALAIENARLFDEQRSVLAAITDGVITIDARGVVASFNEACAALFDADPLEYVGKPVAVLDRLVPGLGEGLSTRSAWVAPREMPGRHSRRQGELTLEVRVSSLELEGTRPAGLAVAITDLSEMRALEKLHQAEVAQRDAIREAFARYLAPHVVEQLMSRPEGVALGGERATATIIFADIDGFTELAGKIEAERVVEILNKFFTAAVQAVFEHDGLLDKFYGDGMMVVFGPPRVRDDDAVRALAVARALHTAAANVSADGHPLRLAIGIATGEVVAGHIGSARRMDYTVIGDAANLASRLQSACPPGHIYLDERTYLRLRTKPVAEQLSAKIRGKAQPVTIYAIGETP